MSRRFIKTVRFRLLDFSELESHEKEAYEAALYEQEQSINPKFQVGAASWSYDGAFVSVRNKDPGPYGHAEQMTLSSLYAKAEQKKMKLLCMAGALPGEEVISRPPYPRNVKFEDIRCVKMCGKCLEFLHDCTANVEDVTILLIADSGQVVKTSRNSLMPLPYVSQRVPIVYAGGAIYPVPSTKENHTDHHGQGLPPHLDDWWEETERWLGQAA